MTYEVRQRNGKKGQGSLVVVVATEPEANEIKTMLDSDPALATVQTIVCERPAVVVETTEQFIARHNADKAKAAKATEALGKLTDEEKAALGL